MKRVLLLVGTLAIVGIVIAKNPSFWDYTLFPRSDDSRNMEKRFDNAHLWRDPNDQRTIYNDPKMNEQRYKESLQDYNKRKDAQVGINYPHSWNYRDYTVKDIASLTADSTVLLGAGYYLSYQFYNWYKGDLHNLKRHINAARSAITKAITIVGKMPQDQNSLILVDDIKNSKTTLDAIHDSIVKEEARRKKK